MKIILLFLLITFCNLVSSQENIRPQSLNESYLGQIPPGDIPLVFASGIISTDTTIEHGSPAFSPDGNEVFWQSNYRQKGKKTQIYTMTMKRIGNHWSKPEKTEYGSGPVFSTNGEKLYFNSKEENGYVNFIEKLDEEWSKPKKLGLIARFPELKFAYNLTFTNKGTLYFLGYAEGLETMNKFGIYRSEFINGEYLKPELLPSSINAVNGALNWTPFIAPDESYLLFSSNRLNNQQDLFISFRRSNGTWTDPYNLGTTINTERGERFPMISPDGKYLFFTRWVVRGNEDVLWVRADFIKELRTSIIQEK